MVNVPSGFTHVVDVSDLSDSTSTRVPCARADTRAETGSGAEVTEAAFAFAGTAGNPRDTEASAAGAIVTTRAAADTTATDRHPGRS